MSKRMRELADKAGYYIDPDFDIEFEEFAELIVKECIAQCEKNKDHEWLGPGSKLSASNIKEHFGVLE
jgi:hypothetical protein